MTISGARLVPLALLATLALAACGGASGEEPAPAPAPDPVPREVEPNDSPASALDLGAGFPLRAKGAISSARAKDAYPDGDRDYYRFRALADGTIAATLSLPDGADYDLALFTPEGDRLAPSRADNLDPQVGPTEHLFASVTGGDSFCLEVAGFAGATAEYELSIEFRPPPAPPAGGPAKTGAMAKARCFHGAALLPDGRAIVGGGTTEAGSKSAALLSAVAGTEIYDPGTGEFTAGPALGSGRFGVTATSLPDGRVLFAGGDVGGTAAVYDALRNVVVRTDIPLAGDNRFLHTATLLPDGRVLLVGGVRLVLGLPPRSEPLSTTTVFDPKTLAFVAGPELHTARYSHATCLLADGRVLATGGVGRRDSEILDLRPGVAARSDGPPLTTIRDDHTATTLADGRVLVTGGQGATGASLDTAEILEDPAAKTGSVFRALSSRMADARSDHQAVRLRDGDVLLLGGESDAGGDRDTILASVSRFDPGSGEFTAADPLLVGRDDSRVVVLPDGRILVTGGEDGSSHGVAEVELYPGR